MPAALLIVVVKKLSAFECNKLRVFSADRYKSNVKHMENEQFYCVPVFTGFACIRRDGTGDNGRCDAVGGTYSTHGGDQKRM
jgi:hypothetical protein